jgi:glutamate racemase
VGGLTVLRELHLQLPGESIVYFADTARLPYGSRSVEEILQFVREILGWMAEQRVKMVIMACNTSSALALEAVRDEFSPLPILGVILPGARAAVQIGKRIGVIATLATTKSNAYPQAIREIDPTAAVWQMACPEFVHLIENNLIDDPYTLEVAKQYLQPLLEKQIDTLVYGCTHYRHLAPIFQDFLPPALQLVDPAQYVVTAAEQELELLGLKNTLKADLPPRFAVSGNPHHFAQLSRRWLGYLPRVEKTFFSSLNQLSTRVE